MKKTNYKVSGMTCDGCARVVKTLLSKVEGVNNVEVDLPQGTVTLESAPGVTEEQLNNALKNTSYRVEG